MNLKFKTASDGLIFYATNNDQQSPATSHLSLVDGQLVFNSQGKELRTTSSDVRLNDNEWHVVTATHDERVLSLHIDDMKNYTTDTVPYGTPPPPLYFLNGNLYIGGVPPNLDSDGKIVPFVGCIGDATLNSEIIINFANTTERPHAFLGKCKGGDQIRTLRY